MSVRPPGAYQPFVDPTAFLADDLSRYIDVFYENHKHLYAQGNFAAPFLKILIEAAKGHKSPAEKRAWILSVHNGLIQKAYPDSKHILHRVALQSGEYLLQYLNDLSDEREHIPYCRLNYDSSIPQPPKVSEHSKNTVLDSLCKNFSKQLKEPICDPFPFFLEVYSSLDTYLFSDHLHDLRTMLLENSLNRIFPEADPIKPDPVESPPLDLGNGPYFPYRQSLVEEFSGEISLKQFYLRIFPFVSMAFTQAQKFDIPLLLDIQIPKRSNCCCTIV